VDTLIRLEFKLWMDMCGQILSPDRPQTEKPVIPPNYAERGFSLLWFLLFNCGQWPVPCGDWPVVMGWVVLGQQALAVSLPQLVPNLLY